MMPTLVVAHQGWDELLLAALVGLITLGVLRWTERRARRREEEQEASTAPPLDDA